MHDIAVMPSAMVQPLILDRVAKAWRIEFAHRHSSGAPAAVGKRRLARHAHAAKTH
jgi:hypothetical protein